MTERTKDRCGIAAIFVVWAFLIGAYLYAKATYSPPIPAPVSECLQACEDVCNRHLDQSCRECHWRCGDIQGW